MEVSPNHFEEPSTTEAAGTGDISTDVELGIGDTDPIDGPIDRLKAYQDSVNHGLVAPLPRPTTGGREL